MNGRSKRAEKRARREREKAIKAAEFARYEKIFRICGFSVKDKTIPLEKVTGISFLSVLPVAVLFGIIFFLFSPRQGAGLWQWLLLLPVCILSVPVHELFHALGWKVCGVRKISFGIEKGFPYCNCRQPLKRGKYLVGCLAPFLLLGILPLTVSLFTGLVTVFIFGMFGIFAAAADFLISLKAISCRGVFLDHPERCGYFVFYKEKKD